VTARPCIDCGEVAETTRCPGCSPNVDLARRPRRGTRTEQGYDNRWLRLSKRARRLQPFCSDCGAVDDLTADHLVWPATSLADVDVVCRSCNSKRGPVRGPGETPANGRAGSLARGIDPVTRDPFQQKEAP
jgi:5-methylcytosine-specific restriction enzyme A